MGCGKQKNRKVLYALRGSLHAHQIVLLEHVTRGEEDLLGLKYYKLPELLYTVMCGRQLRQS
jgi:hypothetical protein